MKPHKHAELIKAWADGAEIEWAYQANPNGWITALGPNWNEPLVTFRIKPEQKPDETTYLVLRTYQTSDDVWCEYDSDEYILLSKTAIKLVWDGETGELKSAEVIK